MEKTSSQLLRTSHRLSQPPQQSTKIYYLVKYTDERTYGVVEEKFVKIIDKSNCFIQMNGRKYGAHIVHFGLKSECEEKSKILEVKLTIDSDIEKRKNFQKVETSDEEGTPRKKYKSSSNLKSTAKLSKTVQVLNDDGDDESEENSSKNNFDLLYDDEELSAQPSSPIKTPAPREKIIKKAATTLKKCKIKRKLDLREYENKIESNEDCDQGDSDDVDGDVNDDRAKVNEKQKKKKTSSFLRILNSFKEDIVKTVKGTQEQEQLLQPSPEFLLNGKNLLMLGGKNKRKYALNVAKELFSNDEMVDCVIMDCDRVTDREPFDKDKIELLKKCVIKRFSLLPAQFGAAWPAIKESINNKGRCIKHRRKLAFKTCA